MAEVAGMKQIATYIVLFAYSIIMLKPVSPYIQDAAAHIFNYKQHMATVHYENGKMHVHIELKENAGKEAPEKEIPVSKKNIQPADHVVSRQKEIITSPAVQISFLQLRSDQLPCNYLAADYPPPRIQAFV